MYHISGNIELVSYVIIYLLVGMILLFVSDKLILLFENSSTITFE